MAQVIAVERGHDGITLRNPGERFTVPDERIGKDGKPADGSTWFVSADKYDPPAPKKPTDRPPGAGPLKGSAARAE